MDGGHMEEHTTKQLRGIRIQHMNVGMIFVACTLYVILMYTTIRASWKYDSMVQATESYIACEEDAALIREGSDFLTDQVRLYVVTLDPKCVEEYFAEVYTARRRERALTRMQEYQVSEEVYRLLKEALENSNRLMEREVYAMALIAESQGQDMADFPDVEAVELAAGDRGLSQEEMVEKARELVFGPEYQAAKEEIMEDISGFLATVLSDTQRLQQDSTRGLRKIMKEQNVLLSILFVETILTFILITWLIIKPLRIYINNIKEEKMLEITGSYEFRYLALTYNDIYEVNAANEDRLRYKAEHDPLTGLINRGAFEQVQQALAGKSMPIALLIVDVDKFKHINDGYGHETGDLVLKKVAKLLAEAFRISDFPARIGGDEFAVIVTEVMPEMEEVIGKKILSVNETLKNPSDGLPEVSLSVGGAFSSKGYSDDLYKKADSALYEVKEHGRCGCRFYHEEQQ